MYEANPVFKQPEDDSVKVWRYMDFTKLVSLMDLRRLYFTRADKFDDPFEGAWPRMNVDARSMSPDAISSPENKDLFSKAMASWGEINRNWPRFNAINCWHMNEHESAAMWRLYLKSDEGIAIQSSYKRLRESFIDDEQVFLGMVNYIDYENEWIDPGSILSPFVHKRKSFEHEKEVRALVLRWPTTDKGLDFTREVIVHGLTIKVDIERLVEKIYVAPSAPDWFAELVLAVIRRYGLDFQVVHSKLRDKPLF